MDGFPKDTSVSPQQQLARLSVWPLEMMLRSQTNLAFATQDALAAFDGLIRCRNIGEAVAIQQQWFGNNLRRLGGAFDAFAGQTTAMSSDAASVAQDSVSHTVESESADTGRAAAHAIQRETRREQTRQSRTGVPMKKAGKQHKSRKRRVV